MTDTDSTVQYLLRFHQTNGLWKLGDFPHLTPENESQTPKRAKNTPHARIVKPRAMWFRTNQIIPTPGISDTTVIAMTSPISV